MYFSTKSFHTKNEDENPSGCRLEIITGVIKMKIRSIVTRITVAAAAGVIAYEMSTATAKEKRTLKHKAGDALYAIGDVMEVISSIMR